MSDNCPSCHCGAPISGDGMYGYYCNKCGCEYGETCSATSGKTRRDAQLFGIQSHR
jgi:hypothetical protein